MRAPFLIVLIALAASVTACGRNTSATPIPTVILGPSDSGGDEGPSGTGVSASAEIVPLEKVNLSFPMVGTVKTVHVEVGDTVAAGDPLITLDTIILEARLAQAEAGVAAAETQVHYLRRVGPGDEQLQAAEAEVEKAQAAVDQAEAILAQAVLKSPIAGTVVAVEIAPGETVVPGQLVMIVGDLTHMQVETTDLSEQDVPAVQVGQAVTVFVEALNDEYEGRVVDIARSAETVGGDVVYKVTIELNEQPDGLRWGMSAEVEIKAAR